MVERCDYSLDDDYEYARYLEAEEYKAQLLEDERFKEYIFEEYTNDIKL